MPIRYDASISLVRRTTMPESVPDAEKRRAEAVRLMDLAKSMLDLPDEEIVAICIDQAVEALLAVEMNS